MSINTVDLIKWNRISIGLGAIVWALIAFLTFLGWNVIDDLDLILLLACASSPR